MVASTAPVLKLGAGSPTAIILTEKPGRPNSTVADGHSQAVTSNIPAPPAGSLPKLSADQIADWFLAEADSGYWYSVLRDAQTQILR